MLWASFEEPLCLHPNAPPLSHLCSQSRVHNLAHRVHPWLSFTPPHFLLVTVFRVRHRMSSALHFCTMQTAHQLQYVLLCLLANSASNSPGKSNQLASRSLHSTGCRISLPRGQESGWIRADTLEKHAQMQMHRLLL